MSTMTKMLPVAAMLSLSVLAGCETNPVVDGAADRAARLVKAYCLLTPANRLQRRADFQHRLAAEAGPGYSLSISCPGDA